MRKSIGLIVIIALFTFVRCSFDDKRFQIISPEDSGIRFSNTIEATDTFNVIDFYYIYNGGGVGIGDFNNDGLQDVYFSGNQVANQLYLNQGDFRFMDITGQAGVAAEDIWSQGVAVVDINNDGWTDIYVCASIFPQPEKRTNKLFINNGVNAQGIPTFSEEAVKWGVQERGHSANAAFLDYDLDGDLDLFVINNFMDTKFPSEFRPTIVDGSSVNSDKLYESMGNESFVDVSDAAGLLIEGYSHGVSIRDINLDGWPDMYVTNDFLPNDILYINNQDGTFTNQVSSYLKHQCFSAMGNDIADINNDGLQEIIALDMLPEINYRKKTMLLKSNPMNQVNYQKFNYDFQFIRNMLHLNQGPDEHGSMIYGDIGFLAGIQETDWSWSPLFADFDNDGFKDLVVANGFPGDVTDMDFAHYMNRYKNYVSKRSDLFDTIPEVFVDNYIFKNDGDLCFTKKTEEWGFDINTYSNGAAFVDLDNDGDLDYITNNINQVSTLYKNNTVEKSSVKEPADYLRLKLKGPAGNPSGIGSKIFAFSGGQFQFQEYSPYRGFMSSVDPVIHFGFKGAQQVDSLLVFWPGGEISSTYDVTLNQEIEIDFANGEPADHALINKYLLSNSVNQLLTKAEKSKLPYVHREKELFDFNYQQTVPHKLSQYTPGIAVSDINNDGLEDLYVGGNALYPGQFFTQNEHGVFTAEERIANRDSLKSKDLGLLFFDADNDHDDDLYIVSGGIEGEPEDRSYLDRLYVNDGSGNFHYTPEALPEIFHSGSCVKAADFDKDGDLDLFVGTRSVPGSYPLSNGSLLLSNTDGVFEDVAEEICPGLLEEEMVTDAIWTDFNNDEWVDLIVVGEWMGIKFYENENGRLKDISTSALPENSVGWWNCISGADIDNDGDIDYICGNLGLNSIFSGTEEHPLSIYAKDFDLNGIVDPVVVKYVSDENYKLRPFPISTRDGLLSQVSILRKRIQTYRAYGKATMEDLFTSEELQDAYYREAAYFQSAVLINNGNSTFSLKALPVEAQIAPIFGIVVEDLNQDQIQDLILAGNDYSIELMTGRIDASNGFVLLGEGNGEFRSLQSHESGFNVPGDAKGLASIFDANGNKLIVASQNKDSTMVHVHPGYNLVKMIDPGNAIRAVIELENGEVRHHEFYYGSSYLSQSSRKLAILDHYRSIVLFYPNGESETVDLK